MKYFLCFTFLMLSFFVSEAQSHIHTIDSVFFIPQLNRTAQIWIYLPDGYEKGKKHYPVLYLQNGQDFFYDHTTASDKWVVDKCLDSLIAAGKQACIVVGIDNLKEKINEQDAFIFSDSGAINRYVYFITQTLKPFIDGQYRTLSSKENTIIAGGSTGALISYYAMMKQPQVFGKAGIFSPALWAATQIKSFTDSLAPKVNGKFFFYTDTSEGDNYIKAVQAIQESLGEKSSAMIYSVFDEEGMHNEAAWRKWFAEFYCWIMAEGFNNVIKINE